MLKNLWFPERPSDYGIPVPLNFSHFGVWLILVPRRCILCLPRARTHEKPPLRVFLERDLWSSWFCRVGLVLCLLAHFRPINDKKNCPTITIQHPTRANRQPFPTHPPTPSLTTRHQPSSTNTKYSVPSTRRSAPPNPRPPPATHREMTKIKQLSICHLRSPIAHHLATPPPTQSTPRTAYFCFVFLL